MFKTRKVELKTLFTRSFSMDMLRWDEIGIIGGCHSYTQKWVSKEHAVTV